MTRSLGPALPVSIAAALLAAACAEDVPGVAPPEREVFYPIGLEIVSTPGAGQVLVVSSSNFDQRYNAGYVSTYSVDRLVALARSGTSSRTVTFVDALDGANPDPFISRVRVPQFGGELAVTEDSVARRVFVASRGRNVVTMMIMDDQGVLRCQTEGGLVLPAFDCSAGYTLRTFADDPYALAIAPSRDPAEDRGVLAIGHIIGDAASQRGVAVLERVDIAAFDARVAAEVNGEVPPEPFDPLEAPTSTASAPPVDFVTQVIIDVGGVAGLVWAPEALGTGRFIMSAAQVASVSGSLALQALTYDRLSPIGEPGIALESRLSAVVTRGLAVSGERAYVSLRFEEGQTGEIFNGGVGVVSLAEDELELVSAFEVGEEPTRPTLLEYDATRLLYLPDLRLDRIFVLDVSNDVPKLVSVISGRANRELDGEITQVRTLASPVQLAIAETAEGRFGFVSNFLNSTIAVLDLSDPDPRNHVLIARLGRNIDPEGEVEAPE